MPGRDDGSRLSPVRVLDLELTALEPLSGLERYVEVQALVRDGGAPVGWVTLPVTNGEVPRRTVERAVAAYAQRERKVESAPRALPSLTVAVCSRDRTEDLSRCLEALEHLEPAADELLVVDNAPTSDETERLVRERHPAVRYVREAKPGLDHARNRAVAEVTTEIVAFTDDDVIVDAGWAHALAAAFGADPEAVAVTGLVVPWELETDAQVLFERYRSFARGFAPERAQADPAVGPIGWRYGNTGRLGTGANMAFRRDVFDRVGLFDPALGAGSVARAGDDLEMFFRLLKAGGAIRYQPSAVVRHRHRRTLNDLQAQMADTGMGFSASLVRAARLHPGERGPLLRLWCWWAAKLLYRAIRPSGEPAALLRGLARAELSGAVRGLGRYRQARAASLAAPRTLTPV